MPSAVMGAHRADELYGVGVWQIRVLHVRSVLVLSVLEARVGRSLMKIVLVFSTLEIVS